MTEPVYHEPVLMKEVLQTLSPAPGQLIVDATLGHGGHSLEILSQLGGEGFLVGIDRDPQMLATARKRIEASQISSSSYQLVVADQWDLTTILAEALALVPVAHQSAPDGFLFDLGPSTPQLLDPSLGLSWMSEHSLDMRLNPRSERSSAAEIVNTWSEDDLTRIFQEYADERWARRIAKYIVEARGRKAIQTGKELGDIVGAAIPRNAWPPKIHPATRVFLALRIVVNAEYETLESALPVAFESLKPGGRLVVISFHSGEDRRVKEFMKALTTPERPPWPLPESGAKAAATLLTRKPLVAGEEEIRRNPRSRSAKLRAVVKN